MAHGKRIKRTSFNSMRDITPESVYAELKDFTFMSGPYVLIMDGLWGTVKVCASSPAECERVMQKMAELAGIGANEISSFLKIEQFSRDPRMQASRRYGLKVRDGVAYVSSRPGPAGGPELPYG
jgi:hypothetical protein